MAARLRGNSTDTEKREKPKNRSSCQSIRPARNPVGLKSLANRLPGGLKRHF